MLTINQHYEFRQLEKVYTFVNIVLMANLTDYEFSEREKSDNASRSARLENDSLSIVKSVLWLISVE